MKTAATFGGVALLMAILVPTVILMQKAVERVPAAAFVITLTGVTLALLAVTVYSDWMR